MSLALTTDAQTGETNAHSERFVSWEKIGSGGVADVYKVFDRELGIELAIKILKSVHREDRRHIESLRGEVLISRKLRHPNICPIHDLYEGSHGVGIVMDLIQGHDLKAWMVAHRGRLLETIAARLAVLRKLTEALAVAHREITHRDLKPANIFLKNGDITSPIVMDFGLSAPVDTGITGLTGGTPKYMAPEQFSSPETVDKRADLFALGILAYELLTDGEIPACSLVDIAVTGQLPVFRPEQILPPSMFSAALPPDLDRLILQMIDHDRERRPQSAEEVSRALAATVLLDPFNLPLGKKSGRAPNHSVPAGSYSVGERAGTLARPCEQPQRKIRLSGFRISQAPVTNREYREFVRATGYRAPALLNHLRFGQDNAPVVMISWDDAAAYARWAGGRLPTELEWEVAARAGGVSQYPWGDEAPLNTQANIDGVCDAPTPVRSYSGGANAWGLTDMCGNVWEWCSDSWDENLLKNLAGDALDPVAGNASEHRAIRGGSYDSLPIAGRCGFRHHAMRSEQRADIGFRVVYNA